MKLRVWRREKCPLASLVGFILLLSLLPICLQGMWCYHHDRKDEMLPPDTRVSKFTRPQAHCDTYAPPTIPIDFNTKQTKASLLTTTTIKTSCRAYDLGLQALRCPVWDPGAADPLSRVGPEDGPCAPTCLHLTPSIHNRISN